MAYKVASLSSPSSISFFSFPPPPSLLPPELPGKWFSAQEGPLGGSGRIAGLFSLSSDRPPLLHDRRRRERERRTPFFPHPGLSLFLPLIINRSHPAPPFHPSHPPLQPAPLCILWRAKTAMATVVRWKKKPSKPKHTTLPRKARRACGGAGGKGRKRHTRRQQPRPSLSPPPPPPTASLVPSASAPLSRRRIERRSQKEEEELH